MKKPTMYISTFFMIISLGLIGQTDRKIKIDSNEKVFITPPFANFPGGQDSILAFFGKNLRWPSPDFCGQGNIIVSLVVEKTGKITNVQVKKGLCDPCDKEAIRVVNLMPNWNPQMHHGEPRKSRIILPVNFKLD